MTSLLRISLYAGLANASLLLLLQVLKDQVWLHYNRMDIWLALAGLLFLAAGYGLGIYRIKQKQPALSHNEPEPLTALSRREQEVLVHLLGNRSNKDICSALCIEQSTLKSHINRIYRKLEVKSRKELLSRYDSGSSL